MDLESGGTEALAYNPLILIVDDDELMREMLIMMVEENGGNVLTACDGREGVEKFTEKANEIDCVVMDFSMPELNGYEAYLEMKKADPQVAVVMISGLKLIPELEELRAGGEVEFLAKPFEEEHLISAVDRLHQKKKSS